MQSPATYDLVPSGIRPLRTFEVVVEAGESGRVRDCVQEAVHVGPQGQVPHQRQVGADHTLCDEAIGSVSKLRAHAGRQEQAAPEHQVQDKSVIIPQPFAAGCYPVKKLSAYGTDRANRGHRTMRSISTGAYAASTLHVSTPGGVCTEHLMFNFVKGFLEHLVRRCVAAERADCCTYGLLLCSRGAIYMVLQLLLALLRDKHLHFMLIVAAVVEEQCSIRNSCGPSICVTHPVIP